MSITMSLFKFRCHKLPKRLKSECVSIFWTANPRIPGTSLLPHFPPRPQNHPMKSPLIDDQGLSTAPGNAR